MFDSQIVRINNWVTRLRKVRVKPEELLLLFPHCLQWSQCPNNLIASLENCKLCGKCRVKDIIELTEKMGLPCCIASGGREAVLRAKDPKIKAILAIACEKELREGILTLIPKPILGLINLRPCGPCKDTSIEIKAVEEAIKEFLIENDSTQDREK